MSVPQKLPAHFTADPHLIVHHLLHLMPQLPTCDECVCIFPEAGSADVEMEVLRLLLDKGVRVSRVYFMDGLYGTLVAAPNLADANVQVDAVLLTSHHELCDALEHESTSPQKNKVIVVPGIHQSNFCCSSKHYTGLARYFATCQALHDRGVIPHGFLNYLTQWQRCNIEREEEDEMTTLDPSCDDGSMAVVWVGDSWHSRWIAIEERCFKLSTIHRFQDDCANSSS